MAIRTFIWVCIGFSIFSSSSFFVVCSLLLCLFVRSRSRSAMSQAYPSSSSFSFHLSRQPIQHTHIIRSTAKTKYHVVYVKFVVYYFLCNLRFFGFFVRSLSDMMYANMFVSLFFFILFFILVHLFLAEGTEYVGKPINSLK